MPTNSLPTENAPVETGALTLATPSALPTLERLRQKIDESTEMRALLIEYVKTNMDADTHFYTIDSFESSGKPALSQDGARNLCSLFEAIVSEPELVEEYHSDGHYSVRALVRLLSTGNGQQIATGSGCCTTRESRYAYRWMFGNQVPSTVNKADLATKQTKTQKTMYRVPNADIADQYNTVLKMAIKRAEVHATLHLPYVSDGFSDGEPEDDDEKALMLKQIGIWARTQKKPIRERAAQLLWGAAIAQIKDLPLEAINAGFAQLQTYRAQGLNWESGTLEEDIKEATATAGKQAIADLFGDEPQGEDDIPETSRKATRKEMIVQIAESDVPADTLLAWLPTQFPNRKTLVSCSDAELTKVFLHVNQHGVAGMTMDIQEETTEDAKSSKYTKAGE